jgi:hypothetical protein
MTDKEKILGTSDAWESGELGADEKHAHPASVELAAQIDDALGMQMISIRIEKSLIESFKILGAFHGIGYQPLMRDALKRFADCEMKAIVTGLVESQRKQTQPKPPAQKSLPHKMKKAA